MGKFQRKFLVTGGTGTLGRPVVARLRNAGHDLRVLSRQSREDEDGVEFVTGDLSTGEGIEAAVDGAEIILHIAGSSSGDEDKARHLMAAASRAGVGQTADESDGNNCVQFVSARLPCHADPILLIL